MGMQEKAQILDDKSDTKLIEDGLENLIAQLGTNKDKRTNGIFVNNKRLSARGNEEELNALYRTDWLAGKVVDIIPNDMTREWRSFVGEIDPTIVDQLIEEEERLMLPHHFNIAHKWARLYGTALIVLSVDDGQTPDKPLDISRVRQGGLRHIKVVDRNQFSNTQVVPINNPLDPNYGFPKEYRFNESSVVIHHSRVLRFDGVLLPYQEFRQNNYLSDGVLDRLYDALLNISTATNGSASMIYETNVDIVKVSNLMSYLQTAEGEANIRKRFALASMLKSFNNMMLLDAEEEIQFKTNTFAGLPDLLDRFAQIITAASDVPATRLLGSSASGLNATGEGDLKNYYDKIRSDQNSIYKPKLDYFDQIMAKSLGIADDADLSYEFDSLFQMNPEQQSVVDLNNAQRDAIYLDRGVITEAMTAKELSQNETYTNITDEHIEELEEVQDLGGFGNDDFGSDTDDNENRFAEGSDEGEEEEQDEESDSGQSS